MRWGEGVIGKGGLGCDGGFARDVFHELRHRFNRLILQEVELLDELLLWNGKRGARISTV